MKTLGIHSLNNFLLYHTAALAIVMLYIVSLVRICLITGSLYLLIFFLQLSLSTPAFLVPTNLIFFFYEFSILFCFLDLVAIFWMYFKLRQQQASAIYSKLHLVLLPICAALKKKFYTPSVIRELIKVLLYVIAMLSRKGKRIIAWISTSLSLN